MATLSAYDLKVEYPDSSKVRVKLINFGSPRVGNLLFSIDFNLKFGDDSVRVAHGLDPVPKIPFKNVGTALEFYHVGREIWYEPFSEKYRICNSSGEDEDCHSVKYDLNLADIFKNRDDFIDDNVYAHLTYMGCSSMCTK